MNREAIKNKIFRYFKEQILEYKKQGNRNMQRFQVNNVVSYFSEIPNGTNWDKDNFVSKIREIIQELINCGLIYPGTPGNSNESYPWLTVTEYGETVFLSEDWLPYDPEGYVKYLKNKVPAIDHVTLTYISEAVSTYHMRHFLSSTLTLGVASENLMIILIEKYAKWIPDADRGDAFRAKIKKMSFYQIYDLFKKELPNDMNSLSDELKNEWKTYLEGIFNFIRINRNEAGHPTGKVLDANVIYANLQAFPSYAEYIFKLSDQF